MFITYLKVDRDLDDVDAHGHDVSAGGAVVPGPGVALEGVGQVTSEMLSLHVALSCLGSIGQQWTHSPV